MYNNNVVHGVILVALVHQEVVSLPMFQLTKHILGYWNQILSHPK